MKFSKQEYWGEFPFPTPGDLPDLEIEPVSLASPTLAGRFLTSAPPGKPHKCLLLLLLLSGFSRVRLCATP